MATFTKKAAPRIFLSDDIGVSNQKTLMELVDTDLYLNEDFETEISVDDNKKYYGGPDFMAELSKKPTPKPVDMEKNDMYNEKYFEKRNKKILLTKVTNPAIYGIYGDYDPGAYKYECQLNDAAQIGYEFSLIQQFQKSQDTIEKLNLAKKFASASENFMIDDMVLDTQTQEQIVASTEEVASVNKSDANVPEKIADNIPEDIMNKKNDDVATQKTEESSKSIKSVSKEETKTENKETEPILAKKASVLSKKTSQTKDCIDEFPEPPSEPAIKQAVEQDSAKEKSDVQSIKSIDNKDNLETEPINKNTKGENEEAVDGKIPTPVENAQNKEQEANSSVPEDTKAVENSEEKSDDTEEIEKNSDIIQEPKNIHVDEDKDLVSLEPENVLVTKSKLKDEDEQESPKEESNEHQKISGTNLVEKLSKSRLFSSKSKRDLKVPKVSPTPEETTDKKGMLQRSGKISRTIKMRAKSFMTEKNFATEIFNQTKKTELITTKPETPKNVTTQEPTKAEKISLIMLQKMISAPFKTIRKTASTALDKKPSKQEDEPRQQNSISPNDDKETTSSMNVKSSLGHIRNSEQEIETINKTSSTTNINNTIKNEKGTKRTNLFKQKSVADITKSLKLKTLDKYRKSRGAINNLV
ncbi:hypothetical protein BB558_006485 [Smittium angustum]|uniref:Uncharacterized protein n=1 Tax=Smittium angustum TaxID=133377 RepID=A0A2U1IXU4_SMIAN|nr:hypothetical protein BB558_006485 [Smittium angustum]